MRSLSIQNVIWAVQPGANQNTRPARLVQGLIELDVLGPDVLTIHHGRSASEGISQLNARDVPKKRKTYESAVLTPTAPGWAYRTARWVDLYDDWSIAPDLRLHRRVMARRRYEWLRSGERRTPLITVNSRYMARKIGADRAVVVPNGVDPELAHFEHGGDESRRLIMLGHFFRRRTDFKAMAKVAASDYWDEVHVAGSIETKMLKSVVAGNVNVVHHPWLSYAEVAALAGVRTVAFIPHVVTNYTSSQDLMKAYALMALGIPTVCPESLWPDALDRSHLFPTSGEAPDIEAIADWVEAKMRPSDRWRENVAQSNSWESRSVEIQKLLLGEG